MEDAVVTWEAPNVLRIGLGIMVFLLPAVSLGADIDADPTNYRTLVDTLGPGDTLRLAPGDYRDCLRISGRHGEANNPIVVEGADVFGGGVVFYGANCTGIRSATIFVEDSSHLVIRNIEIDGEGATANGIRAGYGTVAVHNVTVEGMYIHDNDPNNQHSAVGVFSTSWDWHIRNNRFERNGLGMYLGDSDGSAPFIRGIIEHNLILNPRGYGFQIKHQSVRAAVAGMPQDDSVTIVRRNVIVKAANAGGANDARPNLLIGDLPPSGVGTNDRYEVYQNFFFENASGVETLFQGEGNLSIHDNIFVNTFAGPGIVIRPHNGAVRDVAIFHNTFLTTGNAVAASGGPTVVVANAAYGDGASLLTGTDVRDNVTGTLTEAATTFIDVTPTLGDLDLYPAHPFPLSVDPAPDLGPLANRTDADVDFNGNARTPSWVGAYAGAGANPGWPLAAEVRPVDNRPPPPRDGGVVSTPDGGDGGTPDGGSRDAGTSDAGVVADAGVTTDAGFTDTIDEPTDDGGCNCRETHRRSRSSGLWLLLVVPLLGCVSRSRSRC